MNLKLERQSFTDKATFGSLYFNGEFICFTMERPYWKNQPFISSVEAATYTLEPHKSSKFGETYALVNNAIGVTHYKQKASKRYAILIHPANEPEQLAGCVACGMRVSDGRLINSKIAVDKVLNLIKSYNIEKVEIV